MAMAGPGAGSIAGIPRIRLRLLSRGAVLLSGDCCCRFKLRPGEENSPPSARLKNDGEPDGLRWRGEELSSDRRDNCAGAEGWRWADPDGSDGLDRVGCGDVCLGEAALAPAAGLSGRRCAAMGLPPPCSISKRFLSTNCRASSAARLASSAVFRAVATLRGHV